jgi:hypothetical protein
MEWLSVALEGVETKLDATTADGMATLVAGDMRINGREDVAVLPEAEETVLETWRNKLAVATAESESGFCWLALLTEAMEASGRETVAVGLETEGTVLKP